MFDTTYSTTKERANAIFEGLSVIQRDINNVQAIILGDESLAPVLGRVSSAANTIQMAIQDLIATVAGPQAATMHASISGRGPGRPRKEPLPPLLGSDGTPIRRGPGRPSKAELEARAAAAATSATQAEEIVHELSSEVSEAVREAEEAVVAAVAAKAGAATSAARKEKVAPNSTVKSQAKKKPSRNKK